jgi:hypothetical protein
VCVIIKFLKEAMEAGHVKDAKVLVASMTNVAVDRILLGLLDMGFEDFVRVGSLKKIAKRLLPYTSQQLKNESEDMKELGKILSDGELTGAERALVQETIRRFKGDKFSLREDCTKIKLIACCYS